jgi:polysaccharide export outer membrane protein
LAKGETENAAVRQVAVVRVSNGKRTGAVFDLGRIRRGEDKDPQLIPRDVVIVGHSTGKRIWHDVLRAAPLLNVFAQF